MSANNLFTYAATLVPAAYAAHVTTYLSLLVAGVLAALLGVLSAQRGWSLAVTFTVAPIVALLPQGYEIYLTATNVMWVCSGAMLLLAVIDLRRSSLPTELSVLAFAAVSGLTSVPSAMLAPAFLARRWVAPSRPHFRAGLVLAACAAIEGAVILSHPQTDRAFRLDPFLLTFPTALQTVLSPLIGAGTVTGLVVHFSDWTPYWVPVVLVYVLTAGVAGFVVRSVVRASPPAQFALTLAACWFGVSTLNVLGAIGDARALVSGWVGGRYFLLGSLGFVVLAASLASATRSTGSRFGALLLAMMLVAGLVQARSAWTGWLTQGCSWKDTVESCGSRRPCWVETWPAGSAWKFLLTSR